MLESAALGAALILRGEETFQRHLQFILLEAHARRISGTAEIALAGVDLKLLGTEKLHLRQRDWRSSCICSFAFSSLNREAL